MSNYPETILWPVVEECPDPYMHRGMMLPQRIRESLDRYARYGIPTGDFLKAVLANDLNVSIARADNENLAVLPAITGYIYNALPSKCWGSIATVEAHIKRWLPLSQSKGIDP